MPVGLVFGLLAAMAWGFVDLSGALAARRLGSLRVLAGAQAVSLAGLLAFLVVNPAALGDGAAAGILVGLPLGIWSAFGYLSHFTALRIGPISVVSPVVVAYGGLTVMLAVIVRGEALAPVQALGALLAGAGVVLVGVVFHGGSWRGARLVGPGVAVAVLTVVLYATLSVALATPIRDHGWVSVVLGSRIGNTSFAIGLLVIASRSGSPRFLPLFGPIGRIERSSVGLLVVAGLADILAFGIYARGLEIAPVWLVGLASSFGPVYVVAWAVGRMGERLRPAQWAGLVMLAAGVVVLAVAG